MKLNEKGITVVGCLLAAIVPVIVSLCTIFTGYGLPQVILASIIIIMIMWPVLIIAVQAAANWWINE